MRRHRANPDSRPPRPQSPHDTPRARRPGPGPALRRAADDIPALAPPGLDDRLLAAVADRQSTPAGRPPSRPLWLTWSSLAAACVLGFVALAAINLPSAPATVRSRVADQPPASHGMIAATEWIFAGDDLAMPGLQDLGRRSYAPALDAIRPDPTALDWVAPWLSPPES